jgi:hypothetical protein
MSGPCERIVTTMATVLRNVNGDVTDTFSSL